jgi:hypothetical protein
MCGGELIALTNLENDHAGDRSSTYVMLALAGGVISLFLGVLDRVLPTVSTEAQLQKVKAESEREAAAALKRAADAEKALAAIERRHAEATKRDTE